LKRADTEVFFKIAKKYLKKFNNFCDKMSMFIKIINKVQLWFYVKDHDKGRKDGIYI